MIGVLPAPFADQIVSMAPAKRCVWDTVCGSVQAARGLVAHLVRTHATETTGRDPVAAHAAAFTPAWGDPSTTRSVRWPMFLHARRKAV